jgi:argininosuccinate lyase
LDVPLNEVPQADAKAIHRKLAGDWQVVFDLQRAMKAREGVGMPGPKQIKKQLKRWQKVYSA